MNTITRCLILTAAAAALGGCGAVDRLRNIGATPELSSIQNPTEKPGYVPVRMPMPMHKTTYASPNSLWRSGSRAFFKDQRAGQVGDLVTVRVRITDRAVIDNTTKRARQNGESLGAENAFGLETQLGKVLGDDTKAEALLKAESNSSSKGEGSIRRSEQLITNVAAVVTQMLPNGNMVVEGKQEVRVNFEVRELIVAGVVRPEDIEADNTIDSTKIAEARIAYGGRGQITDVQQPRYGQQALDILLPF